MPRTEIPGKFTPERSAIAAQLFQSRAFDLTGDGGYYDDRSASQYQYDLGGLDHLFNYIRSLGDQPQTVLDIGAGTTRAVAELQQQERGRDLIFIASVLRKKEPTLAQGLISERIYKTPTERLKGIPDSSVSGVISCSGLAYSRYPELAIRSIDRVLVPGGVIKSDFENSKSISRPGSPFSNRNRYEGFVMALQDLGYDVASEDWRGQVVLAIKPGGPHNVSAVDLLNSDEPIPGLNQSRALRGQEDFEIERFEPLS